MFYVYLHCAPDRGPFYVGKGCGQRAYKFYKHIRNEHHSRIVRKCGADNIQVVLIPCADENEAFRVEQDSIRILRLMGFDLVNQTSGGEGSSGLRKTEVTRARISASNRAVMSTDDFKRKRSEASKRMHTEELRHLKSRFAEMQWTDPATRQNLIQKLSGYRWITNDIEERRLHKGERMPLGWGYGRAKRFY